MKARYRLFVHPIQTIRGLWYHYVAVAYDHWHGIETGKRNLRVRYDPTEPKYIRWVLRNLPINPTEYSFVDFGSGKGRVLIAAAERPFAQVIGVEYQKELHEAALKNIRSAKRIKCGHIASVCMDATEFSIPDSPCVLFFYNPFGGGRWTACCRISGPRSHARKGRSSLYTSTPSFTMSSLDSRGCGSSIRGPGATCTLGPVTSATSAVPEKLRCDWTSPGCSVILGD